MWQCVMMVVAIMTHLVAASGDNFMLDDCRVEGEEGNLKFTTYIDTVSLRLTRVLTNAKPVVVIRQDDNEWRFILPDDTKLWKWEDVELKLSEKPKVVFNKIQINATNSQKMVQKRWEVEIENSWGYGRCQKRWPVLELDSAKSRQYFEIPRSGHNEKIKLFPIKATNVRLAVGNQEKVLCQDGRKVVVKDYVPNQTCQKLSANTFTEKIDILVNDDSKSIKIRKENLTGLLYIVHCVDNCDASDLSGCSSASSNVFFIIISLALLLY